jgi:hypothetical protein
LSGREGFGVFEEMKCLFSIAPEAKKGGESPEFFISEKLQPDAGPDMVQGEPVRPISSNHRQRRTRERSQTGASGPSRNRSIWPCTQWAARVSVLIGRGGASGHVRPDTSNRARSSLDSDRMPGAARPVKRCSASGHDNGSL